MQARAATAPSSRPLSAHRPVGTSTATRAAGCSRCRSASRASMAAPGGRRWPMPNRASIHRAGPSAGGGCESRSMPSQRAWRQWQAVSGLCSLNGLQIEVATPASCSSRAITSPSPPLWPGPTSTRAPWRRSRWPWSANKRRLTARAAFSISASTGSPLANSCRSRSAIWLPLTSKWSASRPGQAGRGDVKEVFGNKAGSVSKAGSGTKAGSCNKAAAARIHDGAIDRPG